MSAVITGIVANASRKHPLVLEITIPLLLLMGPFL